MTSKYSLLGISQLAVWPAGWLQNGPKRLHAYSQREYRLFCISYCVQTSVTSILTSFPVHNSRPVRSPTIMSGYRETDLISFRRFVKFLQIRWSFKYCKYCNLYILTTPILYYCRICRRDILGALRKTCIFNFMCEIRPDIFSVNKVNLLQCIEHGFVLKQERIWFGGGGVVFSVFQHECKEASLEKCMTAFTHPYITQFVNTFSSNNF